MHRDGASINRVIHRPRLQVASLRGTLGSFASIELEKSACMMRERLRERQKERKMERKGRRESAVRKKDVELEDVERKMWRKRCGEKCAEMDLERNGCEWRDVDGGG